MDMENLAGRKGEIKKGSKRNGRFSEEDKKVKKKKNKKLKFRITNTIMGQRICGWGLEKDI